MFIEGFTLQTDTIRPGGNLMIEGAGRGEGMTGGRESLYAEDFLQIRIRRLKVNPLRPWILLSSPQRYPFLF
mgnify:CR=1 FL=1